MSVEILPGHTMQFAKATHVLCGMGLDGPAKTREALDDLAARRA